MKAHGLALLLLVTSSSVVVHAQNAFEGLQKYLRDSRYTLLVPPRENVVVGTVVTYKSGQESVVSSKCVPTPQVAPSAPAAVGLTSRTGTMDRTVGLTGELASTLNPDVALKGAFNDARVEKITIEISDPTEVHIESNDLKTYIAGLPKTSPCLPLLTNKKNLVYDNLLSIKGITYSFFDQDGKKISLDATLLQALKLSPTYASDHQLTDTLKSDKTIVLGYRAWQVTKLPGAVKDDYELDELSPDQTAALKKVSGRSTRHGSHP